MSASRAVTPAESTVSLPRQNRADTDATSSEDEGGIAMPQPQQSVQMPQAVLLEKDQLRNGGLQKVDRALEEVVDEPLTLEQKKTQ